MAKGISCVEIARILDLVQTDIEVMLSGCSRIQLAQVERVQDDGGEGHRPFCQRYIRCLAQAHSLSTVQMKKIGEE
jgi:hypothetical protein